MRILNYHGVVDRASDDTHYSYLFADVADFEAQLARLTRAYNPVSLAEIEASLGDGDPLPDRAVHVSFDDGYRNNLVAAELLEKHRVPWSLFVVVDAVLDGYRPWYLRLHDAVRASSEVTMPDGTTVDLTTVKAKRLFAKQAKAEVMAAPRADQDGAVARVLTLPGLRVPEDTAWPMLSPDELRQLRTAGVEIGNHSARHRNLSRCAAADLRDEVVVSRDRLAAALGAPVRYFCYPDGRHNRRAHRAVAGSHALAVATWTIRDPMRPVALRRYEPLDDADLGQILDSTEPWYGLGYAIRWARWSLRWRAREVEFRARPSRRLLLS